MEPKPYTAIDALLAIWRRKYTVASFFIVAVTMVGLFTIFSAKSYKSDAKIFVRLGRENSSMDVTAGLGDNLVFALPLARDAEINSIADMIHNKELFGRVVDKIGAERILKKAPPSAESVENSGEGSGFDPVGAVLSFLTNVGVLNDLKIRERAIIELQKKVGIQAIESSNVVTVDYETYDPKLAQAVVAAIVDEYIGLHARIHRAQGSNDFLVERTEIARRKLFDSEQEFEDFKNNTNLISVDRQREVLVDRIAKLEDQLMDTEALTQSAEAEIFALKQMIGGLSSSQPILQTEGSGNDGIDGMRQELFRLQVRREELLAKHQPESPQVKQVEKQLAAVKKIFDRSESELVELVKGPSRVFEGATLELVQKEPTLVALKTKSAALKTQLITVVRQLEDYNANETKFLRLQRKMVIADDDYQRHVRTLQRATMDMSLQDRKLSNLSVSQKATLNPKPYRPNKLVNLVAGLFLGSLGGCGLAVLLEFRTNYLNRNRELE